MEPGRRWEPWGDYVGLHALLRRLLEERRAAAEAEPDGGTAEGTGEGGEGGHRQCVALIWGVWHCYGGAPSVWRYYGGSPSLCHHQCVCVTVKGCHYQCLCRYYWVSPSVWRYYGVSPLCV